MDQVSETIWRTAEQLLGAPLPAGAGSLRDLGDEAALRLVDVFGQIGRAHGVASAAVCAEIARRSSPELGADSLAKRTGAKDAVELIAGITGASKRETAGAIQVGTLLAVTPTAPAAADPLGDACRGGAFCGCVTGWNAVLSRFVEAGLLAPAGAAAIIRGIGAPSRDVSGHALAGALRDLLLLVRDRGTMTPETLFREAKYRRDGLDRTLILARERRALTRRSLTIGPAEDGMHRVSGILTADVAENLRTLCDGVVAAALRQPRFTDEPAVEDARTVPQLWHDALGAALRIAAGSDTSALPRQGAPVAVIIRATELTSVDSDGAALDDEALDQLDDTAADAADDGIGVPGTSRDVVSAAFVRTNACADGIAPVAVSDDGVVLNLGRTQRLFTSKQRIALAFRDPSAGSGQAAAAAGLAATGPRPGATRTTSTNGPATAATPTWPTASCSAGRTTCCCTPGKNPLHTTIPQRDRPTG